MGTAVQLLDEARKVVGISHEVMAGNVEVAMIASNVKAFISSPFDDNF